MPERYFTIEEANEALAAIRPLAEQMVEHRQALRAAEGRSAELRRQIAGDGGSLDARELAALRDRASGEAEAMARCIAQIQELGVLVKDLDRGLVDFPARRREEDVLLCWQVGEDEIGYWHGLEDGFAGRRPLPL